MKTIYDALKAADGHSVIEHRFLLQLLAEYSQPRNKISAWVKSNDLISIKKGFYVFGQKVTTTPVPLEVIANVIYGPSAISLSYALSFYGLIPERVHTVTSITTTRTKTFTNPLGHFSYQHLSADSFHVGLTRQVSHTKEGFIIASPEKALIDTLCYEYPPIEDVPAMHEHLMSNMRIYPEGLKALSLLNLNKLARVYKHKNVALLMHCMEHFFNE